MYIKKILLIIVLLGLVAGSFFAYYVYNAIFTPNTAFENPKEILYIPSNSNYAAVREMLKPLLIDIQSFDHLAKRKGYSDRVKAGKYSIKKGASNNDIIGTLRSQNTPISVTFNNQERIENLAGRIAAQIEPDSVALLKVMKDASFLSNADFNLDTALAMYIPNKYEFFWNTSPVAFRDRMLKEYKRFWNEKRLEKAKKIKLTPKEVIAIAAIVHKETVKVSERPRVAGVYMNRHISGWKLDADPTVIYAVKREANDWNRVIKRVLFKDLEIDSPYNTYKYNALPPGPIAMPDISAIDAVLNYERHDFYFFVADPAKFGYHRFSKTLAEHNRGRDAYVKWINKKGIKR